MRGFGRVSVSQVLFISVVAVATGLAAGCSGSSIPPGAYPSPLPTQPATANPSPTASVIIIINAQPR